ncbi:MAG: malto-oligosyltrehalose trehalohydrolase [Verrucomicrobiota bacterium]|nr:malto-oligosyltrehalose trehalohydrolase [Verrucomicrobiota bacterium]
MRYRTWCKHAHASVVIVDEKKNVCRTVPLESEGGGYFSAIDDEGRTGDLYLYKFGDSQGWPDPASRWQPQGVHGPAMVIDPGKYSWNDHAWQAPPYSELIIYELHIGTFTEAGTFAAALAKLPQLVELGVNAIEIMPLADFPGARNWGYDGVALYAPSRTYGHPDDLRALVDAAHGHELAVILDVVYNHMGPDGNYLGVYHEGYFNPDHKTPWGAGLHFEEEAVREFFADNAPYWMREFHIDGFRLDATHAIADSSERHILAEISERIHELGGFLVAEDDRNEPELLRATSEAGLGFDGVWSDDFHHVIRVMLTKQREGYYENFRGTPEELSEVLQHGWLYRGERKRIDGTLRGGESIDFSPDHFVYCISNHDQVGNRAFGERLGHIIEPAAYRAASALICIVPYTPMLFMGQEWNASTPFQFFTDHNADLGKLVTEGRRREFEHFAAFRDPETRNKIPDPQAASTFANSKLRWDEADQPEHAGVRELYREFLRLRVSHWALRDRSRDNWRIEKASSGIVLLYFGENAARCVVAIDLVGGHSVPDEIRGCNPLLSSNDKRFGGDDAKDFRDPTTAVYELA